MPSSLLISFLRYSRDCLPSRSGGFVACRCYGSPCLPVHISPSCSLRNPRHVHVSYLGSNETMSGSSKNPYEKSSLVVAADFHTKFPGGIRKHVCSYASGLIYFHDMWISKEQESVICNPITGQYEILPKLLTRHWASRSFLGFDPIDKQFKVLFIAFPYCDDEHKILTLGTEKVWRNILCSLTHEPIGEGTCINGILYYLAIQLGVLSYAIVCFHVRSENFKFIDAKHLCDKKYAQLINYKGKLCGIILKDVYHDGGRCTLELYMWVLEDVEKQEWSTYVYTLGDKIVDPWDYSVGGVTAIGEIVLSKKNTCKPFYVFYFNPRRSTLLSVEIQGFGEDQKKFRVYSFGLIL